MDDFVPPNGGGLTAPFHINFTPAPPPPPPPPPPPVPTNHAPDCSSAHAFVSSFWPPNHRLVPVEIVGVTDPDDDPVTITVTGVTQDEPVSVGGDAMITNGSALVRADRSGSGNGRVYVVSFTASDDQGGSCDGSVMVCVPHDRSQTTCVDDGQNFNSLGAGGAPPGRGR